MARGAFFVPLLSLACIALGCEGYVVGGPTDDGLGADPPGTTGITLRDGTVLDLDGGGTSEPDPDPLVDSGVGTPDPDPNPDPGPADAGQPDPDPDPDPEPDPDPDPTGCGNAIEMRELELTNQARADVGLDPLVCDDGLTVAARLHSQDMCDLGYFSHSSADGRSFVDRIRAEGVTYRTAGENIARGQGSPESVHAAWMGSSGHRANILSSSFGRIGIGYVACPGRGPYWTQDFTD